MPQIILLGSPNGVGKSTHATEISKLKGFSYLDPDKHIQQLCLNGVNDSLAWQHSLNIDIEDNLEYRRSFIVESNLHTASAYNILDLAKKHRYQISLIYLSVDNIELLCNRVDKRVSEGGHGINHNMIKEKYVKSHSLLPSHIKYFNTVDLIDTTNEVISAMAKFSQDNLLESSKDLPNWCKIAISKYQRLKKQRGYLR